MLNTTQKLSLLTCLIFFNTLVHAEESDLERALAVENPLKINHYSKHISLPLENDTNFGYGPYNNYENLLNFKPIVPFPLTNSYDLIVRAIAPVYVRTPTTNSHNNIDGHYINGWGDINPTFFISPIHYINVTWGFGPTLFIPTSTNTKSIGTGKWSAGPELAMSIMPGNWLFGFLTSNIWSFAGDANRPTVQQFSFQYFISYNLPKGWFIDAKPIISANWEKPANQQWLVPVGAGIGHVFQLGKKESLSLSTHAYYNIVRPSQIGPNWQFQLEMEVVMTPEFTLGKRQTRSFDLPQQIE